MQKTQQTLQTAIFLKIIELDLQSGFRIKQENVLIWIKILYFLGKLRWLHMSYKSRNYLIFVAFLFKNEHKINLILEYDSTFDNDWKSELMLTGWEE